MGSFAIWRRPYVSRLRNLIRRSCFQKSYNVLYESHLVQCPQRSRNRHVPALANGFKIGDGLQPRGQDNSTLRRVAEDQK